MIDLPFRADRSRPEPIHVQLEEYLRGLIQAGRLPGGGKLPATRELAGALGVSRATVALAYEELVAEGLLTAHVGQGTFVASCSGGPPAPPSGGRSFVWSGLFAQRVRALALPASFTAPFATAELRYDFRGGQVDRGSLPERELGRAFAAAIARLPELADHVDPFGQPRLRTAIARYLANRGVPCTADDVAIVNGAQQAIDVAAHVLVDPGDTVVMEQPGYFGAALAFTARQAHLVGVGVDAEGMRVDELARVLRTRRVKIIYTTPAAQSPTGAVMSDARRRTLLALADEHQTPIFEDDYDSELRYEGAPVAALKTLDGAGQVVYAGTFSKVLFPSLRVGYVVAARPLLRKMVLARWNADVGTGALAQAALATLLETGGLERHLRRVRKVYAERLRAMLAALAEHMPAGSSWTEPRGGHAVWVTLPGEADAEQVWRAALDHGIGCTRGDVFYFDGRGGDHLSLSFATMPPARIAEGVAALAGIVRRSTHRRRRAG